MADFSVDPDGLRALAAALERRASSASVLKARATAAADRAWGPLGDEYGLPDLYATVLEQADRCLSNIRDFLDGVAHDLAATAGEYEEHDASIARLFDRIAADGRRAPGRGHDGTAR